MPSFELEAVRPHQGPSYLRNSHAEGFFSEEERNRRQKVLERITVFDGGRDLISRKIYSNEPRDENLATGESREGNDNKLASQDFDQTDADMPWFANENKQNQFSDCQSEEPNVTHYEVKMPPLDVSSSNYQKCSSRKADLTYERNVQDKIATRAFYTSTTQKLYQGIDWDNSKARRPDPPSSVIEPRPDMVSQQIRRYETKPEDWQRFSKRPFTWDYLQMRNGHYLRRPFAFTSQCNKIGQIPNYTGHVSGEGEKDVEGETFTPLTQLRISKPRYTITSKRGYIPGYTGCVLWANPIPPLSAEREPRRESTARVHKPLGKQRNDSAFSHQGPLSRMVTLTHPFNPYNKVQSEYHRTASGNRV